jgi:hypothetical protein
VRTDAADACDGKFALEVETFFYQQLSLESGEDKKKFVAAACHFCESKIRLLKVSKFHTD